MRQPCSVQVGERPPEIARDDQGQLHAFRVGQAYRIEHTARQPFEREVRNALG
jgi:hypothetical protein